MAITINGSTNTLTGVAVGGLPDGIVDNDMIANSTIAEAKLAANVNTITMADQWRITSSFSYGNSVTTINANWERADADNPGFIGSAMTESSGVFTFPETGIYRIAFKANNTNTSAAASNNAYIYVTTINSSYNDASISLTRNPSANAYGFTYSEFIFDVEDTSTHKVKFAVYASAANSLVYGHTERHGSAAYFTRLGDT